MAACESLEEWREAWLDERHCIDCKTASVRCQEAMAFRGQLPQIDLEGQHSTDC